MTPEQRAAKAMEEAFKDAEFDPIAFQQITQVMAKAIREAVADEREAWLRGLDQGTYD